MEKALQKNIHEHLLDKNMSVNSLEKQAGLKPSAVQNILRGRSKRPSIQTIHAIANELGCPVDELIKDSSLDASPGTSSTLEPLKTSSELPWNLKLYAETSKVVYLLLKKYKPDASRGKFLSYVDEIYRYSVRNTSQTADKRFAEWLIERD